MPQTPALISGVVRDPDGKPVAQARVYFTESPGAVPDVAALTNEKGEFTLSAPVSGTYGIGCQADGFAPLTVRVTVAGGQKVNQDLKLKR